MVDKKALARILATAAEKNPNMTLKEVVSACSELDIELTLHDLVTACLELSVSQAVPKHTLAASPRSLPAAGRLPKKIDPMKMRGVVDKVLRDCWVEWSTLETLCELARTHVALHGEALGVAREDVTAERVRLALEWLLSIKVIERQGQARGTEYRLTRATRKKILRARRRAEESKAISEVTV